MCVSEGFSGSYSSELGRLKDVDSILLYYYSIINLPIQNTQLFRGRSFRLSRPPARHKSDNCSHLGIERYD